MKLRKYQKKAVIALMKIQNPNEHPVAVAPTGSGKTAILCGYIDSCLTLDPNHNILVISHVEDILKQDSRAINNYFNKNYQCGIYSAGLKSRTIKKITVAGIQSIYRKHTFFERFTKIIIDECHLINHKKAGMYRSFLDKINAQYIGLTATPFRLGHGRICDGDDTLFTKIVYDLSSRKNYINLIKKGYLSNIISRKTITQLDPTNISVKAGDYSETELSHAFDKTEITNAIVKEIIDVGEKYKKWLIFAIDIAHAEHISSEFNKHGIKTICVHSRMKKNRKRAIKNFKNGKYRCAVNVNILTTGVDIPDIDLIATLCPTASAVKHVQSTGRGGRPHPQKKHCLFLDFAGNTERLGPINDIQIQQKKPRKGLKIEPIMKSCPSCHTYAYPSQKKCKVCGYEFQFEHKLKTASSGVNIIAKHKKKEKIQHDIVDWYDVKKISYSIHHKSGSPNSLKVTYLTGLFHVNDWVCLEHKGYAKARAMKWVENRLEKKYRKNIKTVEQLFDVVDMLKKPLQIEINNSGKYPNVTGYKFEGKI